MQLTFLAASDQTPLTKRYAMNDGQLEKHPYPLVKNFSSVSIETPTIIDAFESLQTCADQKLCLLKGNLDRPVTDESRAGRTDTMEPTNWIALDLDFDSGFDSIEAFLEAIGLNNVTYILHHSSSAGVTSKPGLRVHIYMQLANSATPSLLKEWLKHLNLSVPGLRQQCELTASKMAIRWPLDITTCQNDKLLYIADPICEGVDDPMRGLRFELHEREHASARIDLSHLDPARNTSDTEDLVINLRKKAGLNRTRPRTRWVNPTTEILMNPAQAVVTGERKARGFVYLNLNGGDSWAYYYPDSKPEYLYNFKGEPACRLQDIVPEYAAQVKPPDTRPLEVEGYERFCVRDNSRDQYYTALRDTQTNYVELAKCAKQNLEDFMGVVGKGVPEPIPEYVIEFDPTTNLGFNPDKQWINLFRPSHYMLREPESNGRVPPHINQVLESLCGTDEVKEHFLNWLAFIFQYREKAQTSFVFHGIEGTGKGVLYKDILRPILGHRYTRMSTTQAIQDSFNEWASETLMLCLDEVKIDEHELRVPELLRNYITEDVLDMRAMRQSRVQVTNYLNLILFSNHVDMMKVPASDRRYTVAPRQTNPLPFTEREVNAIADELPEFTDYLHNYEVDRQKARTCLHTTAKEQMQVAAEGTGERIMRALSTGDLQFFIDMMDTTESAMPDMQAIAYDNLIRDWYKQTPNSVDVTYDEIRNVHRHLTGGKITKIAIQRMADSRFVWPALRNGFRIAFTTPEYGPEDLKQTLSAVK